MTICWKLPLMWLYKSTSCSIFTAKHSPRLSPSKNAISFYFISLKHNLLCGLNLNRTGFSHPENELNDNSRLEFPELSSAGWTYWKAKKRREYLAGERREAWINSVLCFNGILVYMYIVGWLIGGDGEVITLIWIKLIVKGKLWGRLNWWSLDGNECISVFKTNLYTTLVEWWARLNRSKLKFK